MNTIEKIRAYLKSLPEDDLFTCRDLLGFGTRSAVDNAIYQLIKSKMITRVSRGVYTLASRSKPVSVLELALKKARSFGREIITHSALAAQKAGLLQAKEPGCHYFATNGNSSKFRFGQQTIFFQRISSRKFLLGDEPLGQALRALCLLGKSSVNLSVLRLLLENLAPAQLKILAAKSSMIPAWLADCFHSESILASISGSAQISYQSQLAERNPQVQEHSCAVFFMRTKDSKAS